jgi:hypothetical protein
MEAPVGETNAAAAQVAADAGAATEEAGGDAAPESNTRAPTEASDPSSSTDEPALQAPGSAQGAA